MADVSTEHLRAAWTRHLGMSVGDNDDFFALGGDSVAATSIAADLLRCCGVAVDPGLFYDHPRFADSADAVDVATVDTGERVGGIRFGGHRNGEHPLSYQQEGQVAVCARVGDAHSYHVTYAVSLVRCDVDRLRAAVERVSLRHPALRTGVVQNIAGWRQVVLRDAVSMDVLESAQDATAVARSWAGQDFLLDGSPLARVAIVTGDDQHILVLAAHQLVIDPWSWGVVLRELGSLYDDPDATLPAVPAYSDYARWQREQVDPTYGRLLEYWRGQAAGYPTRGLRLPGTPSSRPSAGPAATEPLLLPQALVDQLRARASTRGATLFHVLLAVFSAALGRWAGGVDDVLIGSATANRTVPGTHGVVGFFVNGRFTRVQLAKTATPVDVVGQVRDTWRESDQHDQAHLEKLVVDLDAPDLVNVKFSLNDIPTLATPLPRIGGTPPTPVRLTTSTTARRHLAVALATGQDGLTGTLTYRTDVVGRGVIGGLVETFRRLLGQTANGP